MILASIQFSRLESQCRCDQPGSAQTGPSCTSMHIWGHPGAYTIVMRQAANAIANEFAFVSSKVGSADHGAQPSPSMCVLSNYVPGPAFIAPLYLAMHQKWATYICAIPAYLNAGSFESATALQPSTLGLQGPMNLKCSNLDSCLVIFQVLIFTT
jgi:hypothetical protein